MNAAMLVIPAALAIIKPPALITSSTLLGRTVRKKGVIFSTIPSTFKEKQLLRLRLKLSFPSKRLDHFVQTKIKSCQYGVFPVIRR